MRRCLMTFLLVLCTALPGAGAREDTAFCRLVGPGDAASVWVSLDGDRFTVGLIGVELSKGAEAAVGDRIEALAGGLVWLEYEPGPAEKEGPLPAFVWLGQPRDASMDEARAKMLNAVLLAEGLAAFDPGAGKSRYGSLLEACEAEARAAGRGIWGHEPQAVAAEEEVVWITASGRRYHRADCRSLGRSKEPLTLSAAKARGYTPCRICNPPS